MRFPENNKETWPALFRAGHVSKEGGLSVLCVKEEIVRNGGVHSRRDGQRVLVNVEEVGVSGSNDALSRVADADIVIATFGTADELAAVLSGRDREAALGQDVLRAERPAPCCGRG